MRTILFFILLSPQIAKSAGRCSELFRDHSATSKAKVLIKRDEVGRALIPEIVNLKADGGPIPSKVFTKYSPNEIAESIVHLIQKRDIDPRTLSSGLGFARFESIPYDLTHDSEIHIYFGNRPRFFKRDSTIDRIIKHGILNQHQTGTSNGHLAQRVRAQIEDGFIGNPMEKVYSDDPTSPIHAIRPKYGILSFSPDKEHPIVSFRPDAYGELTAVLKDSVKIRTTYTPFDSKNRMALRVASYQGPGLVHSLTSQALFAEARESRQVDYVEAQVWGPISIADIKEFLVPPGVDPSTLENLMKTGVPVYQYKVFTSSDWDAFRKTFNRGFKHWTASRVKDKQIFAGDPRLVQKNLQNMELLGQDEPLRPLSSYAVQSLLADMLSGKEGLNFRSHELSDEDWQAFLDFSQTRGRLNKAQKDALFFYHFNSGRYNPVLREFSRADLDVATKSQVEILDSVFQKDFLEENDILIRGANGLEAEPGMVLTEKGYLSTTIRPRVAAGFASTFPGKSSAILLLKVPKGGYPSVVPLAQLTGTDSVRLATEMEILLPRESRYRVLDKRVSEDGFIVYTAVLLPYQGATFP